MLAADATTLITDLAEHPDGSTIDRDQLDRLIIEMRELQRHMPGGLGEDLGDLVVPLEQLAEVFDTGVNRTIETEIYRSRGPGLTIACGAYLSPPPTT